MESAFRVCEWAFLLWFRLKRLQRVEEETTLSAQIWLVGSQIYNDLDLPWSGIDCWWVFRLVFSVNRLL